MDKYLGIVKLETESAIGIDIEILTKFSDSKNILEQWMKLYPNAKSIFLENNIELESFFKDFEDWHLVTEKEKNEAKKLYEEFAEYDEQNEK